ncbi:MAG: ATP-binding protein [Candidatus Aminicenantes bacterium]|nr:MAG: ATP-binding protein [Candidatus Aminicenantes bacterium]
MRKRFFIAFALGVALSVFLYLLSFFLPSLLLSRYYDRSLNQLKNTAESIKKDFTHVLEKLNSTKNRVMESPIPNTSEDLFAFFKRLNLNPEKEGICYCNELGYPILWIGNIIDLNIIDRRDRRGYSFQQEESSHLVRNKASVYLVLVKQIPNKEYIVFFQLIAFLPQFKTPYLQEYHFLNKKLMQNSIIEYYDFRDDVSGLERIFSRHKDEYVGEPGLQGEIQTIIFPLRNEDDRIIAQVNLSSASRTSKIADIRERILLFSYILLGLSLVSLLIFLVKSPSFAKERKFLPGLLIMLTLGGLRLIFFPLGNLEKIQSMPIFSPSSAGFLSMGNFTRSPADIFLTALVLFFIFCCVLFYAQKHILGDKIKINLLLSLIANISSVAISLVLLTLFQAFLTRVSYHSNLNILGFSLKPSFLLLHLSIFLVFFIFVLVSFSLFRWALRFFSHFVLTLSILSGGFVLFIFILGSTIHPFIFLIQGIFLLSLLLFAANPSLLQKKEIAFSAFFLAIFLVYPTLNQTFAQKSRNITQNFLQNIIRSQETWGSYLIEQSLPEIEKKTEPITAFLQNPGPSDLAQTLWEETLIAKFNWYSSLELLSPEGVILSRFSLNVPELFQLDFELPESRDWTISRHSLLFMGIEKDFLIGHKDWVIEEEYIGRLIIYLSVDYDMLPFLYSANPYFELLRITSIPSLNQHDIGFAIFNLDGELLFNPDGISTGISQSNLQQIQSSMDAVWAPFEDKQNKFNSLYFTHSDKIYSLFLPEKDVLDHSVGFLRILFLYLVFLMIFLYAYSTASRKRNIKNPLWSFSNRVYFSFIAIALIPLLLFTYTTRNFVRQMFTQQITEKAEIHANFARRVVEEYFILQQEEQLSLTLPPDNVMLVISSTISNDVNLYQDGVLISSSRREFFDYGILPEMIDGEVFYKILYENNPFYSQSQKIGNYFFHTLTIPYLFQDSLLLISLPFPLEQQEISRATKELLEFFFFISSFFIFIVLLFARGIGSMIITPIKKLLAGTREVGLGNLEVSIPHKHEGEMKTLIDGFNSMVESLKKHQQEMAEMSKKVAWAEMARKVAHEIKNPLTPIQLSAEHLLRVYQDKKEDFEETLNESTSYIIKEVDNLRKIAKEFLEISKESALLKEPFDLKGVVQNTISPYKKAFAERITLTENYQGEDFTYNGDKSKIQIALRNIFTNAVEAIGKQGKIQVKLTRGKPGLTVEISDSGVGMDRETLDRIFEPYFSTKEVGTGLGLSIAKKIIEDHSGKIEVSSKKNEGTKITIFLPAEN